jgi:hypothetical protein
LQCTIKAHELAQILSGKVTVSYSISPGAKKAVYIPIVELKLCPSGVMLWQGVLQFQDGPYFHPYMCKDPSAEPVCVFMRVGNIATVGHQSPALHGKFVKVNRLRAHQRLLSLGL